MKGRFYYLISSFPHLSYRSDSFPTLSWFNDLCLQHLSSDQYEMLKSVTISPPFSLTFPLESVKAFYCWENGLRLALMDLRQKKYEDHDKSLPDPLTRSNIISRIAKLKSPMEKEELLDSCRWDYLTRMEYGHYFDLDLLALYFLKLQLLFKRSMYDKNEGKRRFDFFLEETLREQRSR